MALLVPWTKKLKTSTRSGLLVGGTSSAAMSTTDALTTMLSPMYCWYDAPVLSGTSATMTTVGAVP